MGGVELAEHAHEDTAELIFGARALGERLVGGADGGPVCAVEGGVAEIVADVAPGLIEDLQLVLVKVSVHLGRNRERADRAGFDVDDTRLALLQEINLSAVGRELNVTLAARGGGELSRDDL